MQVEFSSKSTALVKSKATKAMTAANAVTISNADELQSANEILSGINLVRKLAQQGKRYMLDPANESVKRIRDFWRPVETNAEEAYRIVEIKVLKYMDEVQKVADEKKEKIAARVERGTMKAETAVGKMEKLDVAPQKVETKVGQVYFKTTKEVVIEDESKLPREYLIPDRVSINRDAKAGKVIAGVKVIEKKQVVNKIN